MTTEELKKLDQDLEKEEKLLVDQLNVIANVDPASKTSFMTRVPGYNDGDHDEDDYAHEAADFERNSAIERELEGRLREIRKTREKIQANTYGKCENCSFGIEAGRLKVLPIANLCMSCAKQGK